MEPLSVSKTNEQYPLLNVENGLDTATRKPPTTVPRQVKRVLINHWPKILSGYWIAVALFLASALVGYSICVGWQKQPMFLTDYIYDEPPMNDRVFLHHFVPMGLLPAFATYSNFLSEITSKNPLLQINVLFLIDDYTDSLDDLHPGSAYDLNTYKSRNEKDWYRFQSKNDNFRYSVYRLSFLIRRTPLKHHWKTVPLSYLPFYIRVYTVWKIGGIGMDLDEFNHQYNTGLNKRIHTILKNHNDGLPEKDYNKLLRDIDKQEEDYFPSFARILNETMAIFSRLNNFFPFSEDIRSGFLPFLNLFPVQSKYTLDDDANNNDTTEKASFNKTADKRNSTGNSSIEVTGGETNLTTKAYDMLVQYENIETREVPVKVNETTANPSSAGNRSDITHPEGPRVVILYDLSVVGDEGQPKSVMSNAYKKPISHLAINSDGSFIAASHNNHNFLAMLMSASLRGMRPEVAIWNTLQTECSGVCQTKVYCNVYRL